LYLAFAQDRSKAETSLNCSVKPEIWPNHLMDTSNDTHSLFLSKIIKKKKKLLKWKRLLSTWLFCCWRWQRVIYVTIKYKCTFYKGNTLLCRWKLKLSWVEESCQWLWFVLYHPWWDQWKRSCFFLFCFLAVRFMLIVEEGWGDAVEENPKCWKSKRR